MIRVFTSKPKEQYQLAYILSTIAYNVFYLFIWCAQLGTSFKGGGGGGVFYFFFWGGGGGGGEEVEG